MFSKFSKIALVASRLGQFWKILKTLVQLILNSTRPHVITYTNFTRPHAITYTNVLHILRYPGFQWVVPVDTGLFLRSFKRLQRKKNLASALGIQK